ncbi:MAG: hypothetical protein ACP5T4_03930 [Candidatus Micrarchaeia archaeon]
MRVLKYLVLAVVIIAILLAVIFITVHSALTAVSHKPVPAPVLPISLSISPIYSAFLTYSDAQSFVSYALFSYNFSNALGANVTISTYSENPIRPIYVLNVTYYSIYSFDSRSFYNAFMHYLSNLGLVLNSTSVSFVSIQNISHISNNSIVVIPSGLMPEPLLENYSISVFSMLNKGDTIVYAGQSFNKSIGASGIIYITPSNITSVLANYSLSTFPASLGLNKTVLANASNLKLCSKPTFIFSHGSFYEGASYIASHNGTFIAFSNYPAVAWQNVSAFAKSVAYGLSDDFWLHRLAYGNYTLNKTSGSGRLGVFSNVSGIPVSMPLSNLLSSLNGSYTLLHFTAYNSSASLSKILLFRPKPVGTGILGIPSSVNDTQTVSIYINVTTPQQVQMHIDLYNGNMSYAASIPITQSFLGTVAIYLPYQFRLPSGTYIAVLRNQLNQNFSAAIFKIPQFRLVPVSLDFKNESFVFRVYSGSSPITARGQISLNGAYNESVSIVNGTLDYVLPKGAILGYGNQTFRLNVISTQLTYSTAYVKKILHIPVFYIEIGIVGLAVLLLNIVLKPPNVDQYYIDVPSFPPEKKEIVKVSRSDLVNIFDKINFYYHWSFMPVTLEEFKQGINAHLHYGTLPISITTQNTQMLLDQLIKFGDVIEESGYFAPTSWIAQSKHDMDYLVVFRALRDYCVSHAMLFTELNIETRADMLVTKEGRQAPIIIYSRSGMRQFEISENSVTFIVFINSDVENDFRQKLYLSFNDTANVLRLAIEYGRVKLVNLEDLDLLVF